MTVDLARMNSKIGHNFAYDEALDLLSKMGLSCASIPSEPTKINVILSYGRYISIIFGKIKVLVLM